MVKCPCFYGSFRIGKSENVHFFLSLFFFLFFHEKWLEWLIARSRDLTVGHHLYIQHHDYLMCVCEAKLVAHGKREKLKREGILDVWPFRVCVCTYVFPSWRQSTAGQHQPLDFFSLTEMPACIYLRISQSAVLIVLLNEKPRCVCVCVFWASLYMFGYADVCLSDDITTTNKGNEGVLFSYRDAPAFSNDRRHRPFFFFSFSFSLSFLWTKYFFLWKRKDNLKRKRKKRDRGSTWTYLVISHGQISQIEERKWNV